MNQTLVGYRFKEKKMSVVVYSKDNCGYCTAAIAMLDKMNISHQVKKLGVDFDREQLLEIAPQARTFPQIVINGQVIGGYQEMAKYIENTGYNGTGHSLS